MPNSIVTQVVMDANTITTIINNVNSMYANVIAYTVGLVAFVGVLLPVGISFFQNRQIKINHQVLTEKITLDMQAAKTSLIAEIKIELEKEVGLYEKKMLDIKNELKSEIRKSKAAVNGKTHHLQALISIDNKNYPGAFADCSTCLEDYAVANEETNFRRVLDNLLINEILPNLQKTDFDDDDALERKYFKKILDSIEKLDDNGRYIDSIRAINKAFKDALIRKS